MLPPRHGLYGEVSRQVMSILSDVTPLLEQVSVDEAFLDVSGARKLFGSPVDIARHLRERIRREVGVPASVGIAATKHVAKVASAHAKPDGMLLIPESATLEFLHSLPVGALWGVGERTRERLEVAGVDTVGELAGLGQARLERLLGKAGGAHLYALAMGIDPRQVTVSHIEKSIGREETFFTHVTDRAELDRVLLAQAHDTARRLRKKGFLARTVAIKVRFADFTTITRSLTLGQPTALANDIYRAARSLLDGVKIGADGVRLLGLRAEQLQDGASEVQLAFDDDPRREIAESVMDGALARFGKDAVQPASLVRQRAKGSDSSGGG